MAVPSTPDTDSSHCPYEGLAPPAEAECRYPIAYPWRRPRPQQGKLDSKGAPTHTQRNFSWPEASSAPRICLPQNLSTILASQKHKPPPKAAPSSSLSSPPPPSSPSSSSFSSSHHSPPPCSSPSLSPVIIDFTKPRAGTTISIDLIARSSASNARSTILRSKGKAAHITAATGTRREKCENHDPSRASQVEKRRQRRLKALVKERDRLREHLQEAHNKLEAYRRFAKEILK